MAQKPVSKTELRAIKRSADAARVRLMTQTTFLERLEKALHRRKAETQEQNMARRALLWLEVGQTRDLRSKVYAKAIANAVKRNDGRFFIRMGKALSQKPHAANAFLDNYDKRRIEWHLVEYWAKRDGDLPELFYFTPSGLVNVIKKRLNYMSTEDAIVKTRQRLGLKAFTRFKIHLDHEANVV